MIYRFDHFTLDTERETLTSGTGQIALRGQALLVLKLLIERAPNVVSRDEILEQVWGHHATSESTIAQVMHDIRAALDDSAHSPRLVATRYGRGYQFVAEVETVSESRQTDAPRRVGPVAATVVLLVALALALLQWPDAPQGQDPRTDRIVLRALQAGSGESLSAPFVDYLAFVLGQSLGADRVEVASGDESADAGIGIGLNSLSDEAGGSLELLLESAANEPDEPTRRRFQEASQLMQASLDSVLAAIDFEDEIEIQGRPCLAKQLRDRDPVARHGGPVRRRARSRGQAVFGRARRRS